VGGGVADNQHLLACLSRTQNIPTRSEARSECAASRALRLGLAGLESLGESPSSRPQGRALLKLPHGAQKGTIKGVLTANTAREGLSEVRQEPVNLCKRLGVSGVVVEHEAARGNVESSSIHGVHCRRFDTEGSRCKRNSGSNFAGSQETMANLQQFGRDRSRTTGRRSNQSPCKFVKLEQSSHTWGLGAPPPSLRLADQKKKSKEKKENRRRRGERGQRRSSPKALSLAPGRGGRAARLQLHVRPRRHLLVELARGSGLGRAGPGRAGGRLASHGLRGPSYSIAAPGEQAAARSGARADVGSRGLVRGAAAAAEGAATPAGGRRRRSCHGGRGPDCALALRPAAAARCSWSGETSERAGGRESPPPRGERERGGRGRERGREGGSARAAAVAAAGGGGEQARRAAAAPLALQSHTPGSPTQAPPPHCPAIFSGLYRRLFRQARRPPPPRSARQPAAKASARPARPPPPPPPSAHGKAPLQAPPPRLAALTPTPRAALAR
jgi:hypothetical protein